MGHPNIYEPEIYFKMTKAGAAPMSNSIGIYNFEAKMLWVISSLGVNSFWKVEFFMFERFFYRILSL